MSKYFLCCAMEVFPLPYYVEIFPLSCRGNIFSATPCGNNPFAFTKTTPFRMPLIYSCVFFFYIIVRFRLIPMFPNMTPVKGGMTVYANVSYISVLLNINI